MTETEQKALALLREVEDERGTTSSPGINRVSNNHEALCRAIEQHEAYKQEVSDAVEDVVSSYGLPKGCLARFIIAKPDPVKMLFDYFETTENFYPPEFEGDIRAALAARGLEVRKIGESE